MVLPAQGMMLSERPSTSVDDSKASAVAGTALAAAGSIGNYKGVMLCNRPFAGTAIAAKGRGAATAATRDVFITGKVKTEVGYAARVLQADKLLRKRVKKETALTRHKRWLVDLQMAKQTLEDQCAEDLKKKEENKRCFAKREARMRRSTREFAAERDEESHARTDGNIGEEEHGSQAWAIGLDSEVDDTPQPALCEERKCDNEEKKEVGSEMGTSRIDLSGMRTVEKRRKRDGKSCRPKWAMTESKAEAEDELKHEEELEELLKFTRELDFTKYIRDAEIQSMIDQVRKRITEIETKPEVDGDSDEGGSATDGNRQTEERLEVKIMKLTDKNLRGTEELRGGNNTSKSARNDDQQEDDNMSIARTALSEGGRSVRSIHSARSLAAVAEKARESISTVSAAGFGTAPSGIQTGVSDTGAESTEVAVNDIMVMTHKDDGGLRLGGKNTVSNLPYIRRNPAV